MSSPSFTVFTPVAEIKKVIAVVHSFILIYTYINLLFFCVQVYPNLSDERIQQTIKNFKVYDLNGDGMQHNIYIHISSLFSYSSVLHIHSKYINVQHIFNTISSRLPLDNTALLSLLHHTCSRKSRRKL